MMTFLLGLAASAAARVGVPLWAVVALALAAVALLFGGTLWALHNSIWNEGYAVCDSKWTAKALEAKISSLENQLEATRRAKAIDDKNGAEIEDEFNNLQKKVLAYEAERKKRGDYCPLGNDASGLR